MISGFHREADKKRILWVITHRTVVFFLRMFRNNLRVLNHEDGTDRLSHNVYKKLPLLAA